MPENFYQQNSDEVLKQFGVGVNGLPLGQTVVRLRKYGPNRLPQEKAHPAWRIFFEQFQNVLVYILIIAAVVSFALHEVTDGTVIVIAIIVNVVVGFIQENKAQRSLEALRQVMSVSATVIRDGKPRTIDAEQVVPGDILRLQAGDRVPADARLLETRELEINEASLTGESEPVEKVAKKLAKELPLAERSNMAFSSTVVTGGTGLAVVVATGVETEIGKIAALIKETPSEETPLQHRLSRLAKVIGVIVLTISALLVLVGMTTGLRFSEIFTTAVAIAVSAIPEGLVISVTVILAIGMQRILKRRGLVRALLAAETLGSTDVVCTDKTGTLTEGKMRVVEVHTEKSAWTHEDKAVPDDVQELLRIGMLCNDAIVENPEETKDKWVIGGNLTDRAMYSAGIRVGFRPPELKATSERLTTIPFSSSRKFMATLHKESRATNIYLKGAPERVLERCTQVVVGNRNLQLTDKRREEITQKLKDLADKGLRTLAVAYKKTNSETLEENQLAEMVFLGIVGIQDPLRATSKPTVLEAQKAGIRVVMVTGDHPSTANSIARKLKLSTAKQNVIEGIELDAMEDRQLEERIDHVTVFSRVSPEHKIRIVNALQAKDHVVAMTGDGVNDAPALKKADIGVALGSGTQVAKDSSDLVLLNNDFSTIIAAVREGRLIFNNIKKVVLYLLADSLSEVVLVVSSLFMGLPLPITATQILWVNLTSDTFPALALTSEPAEPGLMDEPPRPKNAQVVDKRTRFFIASVSLLIGFGSLLVFWIMYRNGGDYDHARTVAFMTLGVSTILYTFSVRSMRHSILKTPLFNNPKILIAVGLSLALQIASAYVLPLQVLLRTVPLTLEDWGLVMGLSVLVIVFIEISKWAFRMLQKRQDFSKAEASAQA